MKSKKVNWYIKLRLKPVTKFKIRNFCKENQINIGKLTKKMWICYIKECEAMERKQEEQQKDVYRR